MKMSGAKKGKDKEVIIGWLHGRQRWSKSEETGQGKSGYFFLFIQMAECVEVCVWQMWQACLFNMYNLLSSSHSFQFVLWSLSVPLFPLSVTNSCPEAAYTVAMAMRMLIALHVFHTCAWPNKCVMLGYNIYQARVTSRPEKYIIKFKVWNLVLFHHELYPMAVSLYEWTLNSGKRAGFVELLINKIHSELTAL